MAKSKIKNIEKKDIKYHKIIMTCACGAEFDSGSTLESVHVDICSKCHPFFTGEDRIVDVEGRVEKFRKKYEKANTKATLKKDK